jgi:hypothetical protein
MPDLAMEEVIVLGGGVTFVVLTSYFVATMVWRKSE